MTLPAASMNGHAPVIPAPESWDVFRDTAPDAIPTLIDGLWPEGALGFLAGPPKQGKTWIAIQMALAVSQGLPFVGHWNVPEAAPVLYVALEGHRAAIRDRIAVIARGMGLDPERELPGLHLWYRPPGINLSDRRWADALVQYARGLGCRLVILDVLRRAARVRESGEGAQDFAELAANLAPLQDDGCAVAILHHFRKGDADSTPDRMSGSGSLFGFLDVGLFVKKADKKSRTYTVEVETRDLAAPPDFKVQLSGEGSGPSGTFLRGDTALLTHQATGSGQDAGGQFRPTGYMEKISRYMERHSDQALTSNRIIDGVGGRKDSMRQALDALVMEGYIEQRMAGQARFHTLSRPYREADDPRSKTPPATQHSLAN